MRLWFPGMPEYCRACFKYGHSQAMCSEFPAYKPPNESTVHSAPLEDDKYNPVAYRRYNDTQYVKLCDFVFGKIKENEEAVSHESDMLKKLPDCAGNFGEFPWWTKYTTSKKNCAPPFNTCGDFTPMTIFSSRHLQNAFLSNFAVADPPIRIWDEDFSSVEKFIAVWKARLAGDTNVEHSMKGDDDPYKLKQKHFKVNWDGDVCQYTKIIGELICVANYQKYKQSPSHKEQLLRTAGTLVEAVPIRSQWGCGLRNDNPDILFKDKWPEGCLNINGELLTVVRQELLAEDHAEMDDEDEDADEGTDILNRPLKRGLEGNSPPIAGKKPK